MKPYGLKTYWNNDIYVKENIDDSLDFKPLENLLSKK